LTAELVKPKIGTSEEVREGREGSSKDVEKVNNGLLWRLKP